jgi:thioredoxin 1
MHDMRIKRFLGCGLVALALFALFSCEKRGDTKTSGSASAVKTIETGKDLSALMDTSKNRLLMFDLYADWCVPCRVVSPVLEKIAVEMKGTVSVYKIDIDKNPDVASTFRVSGIPYVVLVKNKAVVQAFIGIQGRDTYIRAISSFSVSPR